ncbi:S8 family peptidase [Actinokineospora iranica]|uniref:Subtilase family protein n=1 Tax=Actinokineospora iranica TaxID=1271860 RepID=A0A1G6QJW4_9PSEU|nr:S8/S53 family peptidase [Actinokineospora iranica]SDC92750.1 Subtilase family protein [Actinokineospora iranica]
MHTERGQDSLADLADRSPDLVLHDPGGPAECLVRRGQLLVPRAGLDRAVRALDRWIEAVDPAEHATLRLRPGAAADCVRIAAEVADLVPVSANHVHTVLVGAPILHGTGAAPVPAPLPPEPPRVRWDPPVTVLMLDTGIDPHPWFVGRPWFGRWDLEVLDADHDRVPDRQAGHGTFVAGVVLSHAPGATLRQFPVLSSQGLTDDRTVAATLRRARHLSAVRPDPVDVLLLTAGCHTADDRCPPVLARELAHWPTVVAAAGNTGTTRPFWPAALPTVTAVGALSPDGSRAPFSNHGPWVDRWAPGVDIVSSHVRLTGDGREYGGARWSGTSFAAPRVAAAVAMARAEAELVAGA